MRSVRRTLFNRAAEDYDAVRPGYPEVLIQDVIAISGIPEGGAILEVGCGTGQATLPFAGRGYAMRCLDLGEEMVALAQEKCRPYPKVRIEVSAFEDWEPEGYPFDLIISATAFHWVPPEVGYPKAAALLKDSGWLAIFSHHHPRPFTGFSGAVQEVYERVVPEWTRPDEGPSTEEFIASRKKEIEDSGCFGAVQIKQYRWAKTYDRVNYLRLLNTYSDHQALEAGKKEALFSGVGDMIDRFGGTIERPYLSVLYMARKKAL